VLIIVFCNMNGDLQEDILAVVVANERLNNVNIFGFSKDRHYLSYIFDRDKPGRAIHKAAISEAMLIETANKP